MDFMRLIPSITGPARHLPVLTGTIQSGFPKASEQYDQAQLSLNELLIQHKSATFFALADNYDFESAGIYQGDILIVDSVATPRTGDIVICEIVGEILCARLDAGRLLTECDGMQSSVACDESVSLKGVVTQSVRMHRPLPNSKSTFEADVIDLHNTLITNEDATYFAWAEGQSMCSIGILDGDLLVIDRSLEARNNDIVIANIENQFMCKRLDLNNNIFVPESDQKFPTFPFTDQSSLAGIVAQSIRLHRLPSAL